MIINSKVETMEVAPDAYVPREYVARNLQQLKLIKNPSEQTLKVIALSEKSERSREEDEFLENYWRAVRMEIEWEEKEMKWTLQSQGMRTEKRR